jgi:C4-dicarboxylate-specific signal transduction histidine kinase
MVLKSRELEELRAIAINKSKMAGLGEMAGFVAHEIKNPLAIITTSLSVVKEMIRENRPFNEALPFLENIKTTTSRIDEIVNNLKFYSQDLKDEQMTYQSITEIIKKTVSLSAHKLHLLHSKLEVQYPEKDFQFECRPAEISQALLNLLSNATDAVSNRNERWIRIECHRFNDCFEIRVLNSGPAITSDALNKIMTPYFSTKPKGTGTGLGLSIVRGVVESHNGSLYLDTNSLHTSFNLKFPLSKSRQIA